MYEFSIYSRIYKKDDIIFGYDYKDACRRAGLNPDEWFITTVVYAD